MEREYPDAWEVWDKDNENRKGATSRSDAEDKAETAREFGSDDVEILPPFEDAQDTEVVEEEAQAVVEPERPPTPNEDPLAQLGEELGTDPLDILPGHMTDRIQDELAVNKRGYAMIAERFGIEVNADVVEFPWDNEESRCVATATATTDSGDEYSGWATACADDGDMPEQLIELAETRSLKRAVSWASGVGIVSYQELSQQLEARQ